MEYPFLVNLGLNEFCPHRYHRQFQFTAKVDRLKTIINSKLNVRPSKYGKLLSSAKNIEGARPPQVENLSALAKLDFKHILYWDNTLGIISGGGLA